MYLLDYLRRNSLTFGIAAEEAARSRLLGGIHYIFGCENGLAQGKKLGQLINERIEVRLQDEER